MVFSVEFETFFLTQLKTKFNFKHLLLTYTRFLPKSYRTLVRKFLGEEKISKKISFLLFFFLEKSDKSQKKTNNK